MLLVQDRCRHQAGCGRALHAANVAPPIGFGKAEAAPGKPNDPEASINAAAPALHSLALANSLSLSASHR
jgi:hypothetical protein